jgi:hypothetical protein
MHWPAAGASRSVAAQASKQSKQGSIKVQTLCQFAYKVQKLVALFNVSICLSIKMYLFINVIRSLCL